MASCKVQWLKGLCISSERKKEEADKLKEMMTRTSTLSSTLIQLREEGQILGSTSNEIEQDIQNIQQQLSTVRQKTDTAMPYREASTPTGGDEDEDGDEMPQTPGQRRAMRALQPQKPRRTLIPKLSTANLRGSQSAISQMTMRGHLFTPPPGVRRMESGTSLGAGYAGMNLGSSSDPFSDNDEDADVFGQTPKRRREGTLR